MVVLPLIASVALAPPPDDLDRFVEARMREAHVPGLGLAVIRDGKVVKLKGYGLADVEEKKAVTPSTSSFRPGSPCSSIRLKRTEWMCRARMRKALSGATHEPWADKV